MSEQGNSLRIITAEGADGKAVYALLDPGDGSAKKAMREMVASWRYDNAPLTVCEYLVPLVEIQKWQVHLEH